MIYNKLVGEFMDNIDKLITKDKLIVKGDVVGVACSGGIDSMVLLHYLNANKEKFGCEVMAINIDHCIRANSANDSMFVINWCKANGIKCVSQKVDVNRLVADKKYTVEQAARELRYKAFKKFLDKKVVTKIALGHHLNDQAETILLNIFRGAGLSGARGMDSMRDGVYIRPMLDTPRVQIQAYAAANDIPFVEDETNLSNEYSRNYIRNMVMPILRSKWSNVDANVCAFGKVCASDDDFIYSQIASDAVVYEDKYTAKIYVNYFVKDNALVYRLILDTLKHIGVTHNIEKKHLNIIKSMALESANGSKISLPEGVSVIKEYNFITLTNRKQKVLRREWKMARGKIDVPGLGVIEIDLLRKFKVGQYKCMLDHAKLPKNAVFRCRRDGDYIEKFGGGTKSLNEYFIEKKVPARLRDILPVLAVDNEVYCVPGVDISNKVKVDKKTVSVYVVNLVTF